MSYWKISCIATLTAKAIARIKIAQNNTVPSLRALSIMALSVMFYCITTGYVAASCECNAGGTCYDVTNDTSFDSVPWLNLSPGDTIRIHYRATPYQRNVSLDDSGTFENPITICGVADPDNNRPTISGSGTGPGGNPVIYIGGTSNIQIEGLILTQGRRGIESDAWPGSDNIVISNNEIFTNGDTTPEASNHGGGINIYGDDIHIVNNTVRNNFSGRSGGIFIRGTTNEIRGNLIQNNRGYHDHGGGLYINGSSDTTVAGNIIEGNVTGPFQGGGHGGGILIAESSNISLSYNTVRKNFAYAAGAGMWIDEASTATLDHELVYNNVSNRYGAGIGVDERYTLDPSHAVITNSTIAYNYSTQDRSYGYGSGNGLMCDTGSTAEVRNTIFYGNKRLTGCSDLQSYDLTGCDFSGPPDDFRISTQSASVPVDPGAITMTYSLSGQSWPGIGNTHVDPLFIDSNNGDFHLASSTSGCSPAIDAGDPASLYSNELEDNGDRINMGVYGNTVEASNPCSCRGNGNCYEITDESSFDAVPWLSLGSGDTVLIHHKLTPYRKRFGLHAIGTASQPVRITGVRSPDGDLPHLLGENATTPANMSGFYDYGGIGYPGFRGMVLINGMQWGEIPSNIIIENLKITGANQNNTFYDEEGTQRTYYGGAGGIYVYVVNGLTVRNCEIADNGNGFYTRSTGAEEMTTRNILVERNYIHSNGNVGGDQRHNIYTESAGITFQYNRIGRERPGAGGSSFKDRSSGLVFRYNWIESTARTMDMVEAEDGAPILIYEPDYDKTYVYGNVIINEVDDKDDYVSAVNLIHYGGDNNVDDGTGQCTQSLGGDPVCRTGTLYFFNNTVIVKDYRDTPAGYDWTQTRVFEISVNDATVDIRNNVFHLFAPNGYPRLALMDTWGTANLNGTNWITSGWVEGHYNNWPGAGAIINRNGTLLEGLDPGLKNIGAISGDLSGDNYIPLVASPVVDRAEVLPFEIINSGHNISRMYQHHQSGVSRTMTGESGDLGAFEFGSDAGLPAVLEADFNTGNTTILAGRSVQFTDTSSGNPHSWTWDFGDGNTSSGQHPQHVYQSRGSYTVSLTVTGDSGSDTETKQNYISVSSPVSNILLLIPPIITASKK